MPCSGAATTSEEVESLCAALSTAGVVMRYGNIVYLKPEEVEELLLRVRGVPGDAQTDKAVTQHQSESAFM